MNPPTLIDPPSKSEPTFSSPNSNHPLPPPGAAAPPSRICPFRGDVVDEADVIGLVGSGAVVGLAESTPPAGWDAAAAEIAPPTRGRVDSDFRLEPGYPPPGDLDALNNATPALNPSLLPGDFPGGDSASKFWREGERDDREGLRL